MRNTLKRSSQRIAWLILLAAAAARAAEPIQKGDSIVVTAAQSQVKDEDKVVAVVSEGDRLKVVAVSGDWIGVEAAGTTGWLPRGDVARTAVPKSVGRAPKAPAKEKPAFQKWAILIGCDDYITIRKLKYAGADVRALSAQLISSREANDPLGPSTGENRVARGGSWPVVAQYCRSAYRVNDPPDYRNHNFGFRVVRDLD